jgi:hypothetical protein
MWNRVARMFRGRPAVAPTPTRRARLAVEPLEGRAVPAFFTAATVAELIQHINDANALPGPDTISLASGATFNMTAVNNTVHGATGLPVVTDGDGLTIVGNGATIARTTVSGTPACRLLDVGVGASLSIQSLTLQGGLASSQYGGLPLGGAVYNQGNLTLEGVTVRNNTAQGADGTFGGGGYAAGGGVYSLGSLTVNSSSVFQNNKAVGGNGSDATGGPDGSRAATPGGRAFGGALDIAGGTASVSDTTFTLNVAQGGAGGGGSHLRPGAAGGNGSGGGVYLAGDLVTLLGVSVNGNSAVGGAGGKKGGTKGQGIGGGVYIAAATGVTLDLFTRDHVKRNTASTSDPDIYGAYTVI